MMIESEPWKAFLSEAYRRLNEAIKREPPKAVVEALQTRIDVIGLILGKLIQLEQQGGNIMPVEYGDLIEKMASVEELQSRTRRTQLGTAVLKLADTIKRSKEKGAYVDATKVKYASFYRVVKSLLKSGELEKGFFVSKDGDKFGLGYSTKN